MTAVGKNMHQRNTSYLPTYSRNEHFHAFPPTPKLKQCDCETNPAFNPMRVTPVALSWPERVKQEAWRCPGAMRLTPVAFSSPAHQTRKS